MKDLKLSSSYKFISWYLVCVNSTLKMNLEKLEFYLLFIHINFVLIFVTDSQIWHFLHWSPDLLPSGCFTCRHTCPAQYMVAPSLQLFRPWSWSQPWLLSFVCPTFKWSAYPIDSIFTIETESNQLPFRSFITSFPVQATIIYGLFITVALSFFWPSCFTLPPYNLLSKE